MSCLISLDMFVDVFFHELIAFKWKVLHHLSKSAKLEQLHGIHWGKCGCNTIYRLAHLHSFHHRGGRSCDGNSDRPLSYHWITGICSGDCSSVKFGYSEKATEFIKNLLLKILWPSENIRALLWLVKIKQKFIISIVLSYDLTMVRRNAGALVLQLLRKWCVIGTINIPFKNCHKNVMPFYIKISKVSFFHQCSDQ